MLGRLLGGVVALGVLACFATVGFEAVGLLYRPGVPDPQQRIDAFVARLEADISPVDLPTEPVELPREVAQEHPVGEAGRAVAVADRGPDAEGAQVVAERPRQPEPGEHGEGRLVVAFSGPLPASRQAPEESAADPETAAHTDEAVASIPAEDETPASAPQPSVQASSTPPAMARPAPRAPTTRRTRPAPRPAGYAAFGWPVLDWLTL